MFTQTVSLKTGGFSFSIKIKYNLAMPELPEIETLKNDFNQKVKGEVFERVIFDPNFGNSIKQHTNRDLETILPKQEILEAKRIGKYLVLDLSNSFHLTFHLKIYGRLLIGPVKIPFNDPLRVTFQLKSGKQIRLIDRSNIASVFLLNNQELEELKSKHGPDPFVGEVEKFHEKLKEHASLAIKEAILKPIVVEGVGNIYADEALFLSGIYPLKKAVSLTSEEAQELFTNIKKVLEQGIKYRGTSIESWYDTSGVAGENQNHLQVYGQANKSCPACSSPIKLIEIAGRRTYFCPTDQPDDQLSLF